MKLTSHCKGCEWTVDYDLDDAHSYLAAMTARNQHVASCAEFAAKKAAVEAWVKTANEGGMMLRLEDYEEHRKFDPFLAARLRPGALEDLLDTALDQIVALAERLSQ